MDPARTKAEPGNPWTNEMHASFLNRIEAAFVKSMLLGFDGAGAAAEQRLDRVIPDSATESTRDCQSNGRAAALTDSVRRHRPAQNHNTGKKRVGTKNDSSNDQVVPGFVKTRAEKGNISHRNKRGNNG